MLSSISKLVATPRLSLSLIKQQYLSSSSKGDSTSKSTGDTKEKGKDIHKPDIDASHQSGSKNQKQRTEWENKEQGFTNDTETRQERKVPNEKDNVKTKSSKK